MITPACFTWHIRRKAKFITTTEKNLVKREGENKKKVTYSGIVKNYTGTPQKNFVFTKIAGKYQRFLAVGARLCFISLTMIQYTCWEVGEFLGIPGS